MQPGGGMGDDLMFVEESIGDGDQARGAAETGRVEVIAGGNGTQTLVPTTNSAG